MRLVLAAVLLLLALPAAAPASTVSVVLADGCQGDVACTKYGGAPPVPVTTFEGAPGEANQVFARQDGSEFTFRDDGAVLQAEAPCTSVDAHVARCPVTNGDYGLPGIVFLLGDGDDRAGVPGSLNVPVRFSGGPGDDAIGGGPEPDEIDGGPGADRLDGGTGTFDDTLTYASRTAPVRADLRSGAAGEAGEGDVVRRFEIVVGGAGDDTLVGTDRADTLDGGDGDDVLRGRDGDDALFGGTGADRLSGQDGDDHLFGDPAQGDDVYTPIIRLRPDRLSGGRGDDVLEDTGGRNTYLGGPGADVLEGGAGRDLMLGGSGPDRVLARGGGSDDVRCGSGRDLARTDTRDLRRSCERGR